MLHYYMVEKFNQKLEEREKRWEEEDESDNNNNIEGREELDGEDGASEEWEPDGASEWEDFVS